MPIAPYNLVAFNASKHSENKMHDDGVARQFGFAGGLVAGAEIFAYMAHMPVEAWGRPFLEYGSMEGRFLKPIYDGQAAVVFADEDDDALKLRIESGGHICGAGRARLLDAAPAVNLAEYKKATPPAVEARRPVGVDSYPVGSWLGIRRNTVTEEVHAQYLKDIGESNPLFVRDGFLHPGTLLRCANWALMQNVKLGPWIHVGSTLQHLAPGMVGDTLTVRARVTENVERKGHKFVGLDALVVANGETPIARILHSAIYAPRLARPQTQPQSEHGAV